LITKEILFVCSEKKLLESTKKHLENYNENYSLHKSDSVEKAIKLIQKQTFDVIISDYNLKNKNGLEFLAHLKDIDYKTSFILLIDKGREEIAIKALNLGAEYYIHKSNNLKLFLSVLTNYIDNLIKKTSIKMNLDKAVTSLSKNEERMGFACDTISAGFCEYSRIDDTWFLDPSILKVIGYSLSDIPSLKEFQSWAISKIHEDDLTLNRDIFQAFLDGKDDTATFTFRFLNKNKEWLNLETQIRVSQRDLKGAAQNISIIAFDKSRQKAIEINLRESEDRFHTLVDNMSDALGIINAVGELTYVNSRFCEMLGYSEHDMLKHSLTDFLSPSGKKEYKKQIAKRRKGIADSYDQEWLNCDGEVVYTIVSPQPIFREDGTYDGSFAVITDITERKQDEEQIRIAYEQLNTIFETAGDGLIVIDHQFNMLRYNNGILEIFGYKKSEVANKKCFEVFPHINCHTSACTLSQVFKNKKRIEYESTKQSKNGKSITCLITATPLHSLDGKLVGIVENLKDITERKKVEEEIRKSKEFYQAVTDNAYAGIVIVDLNENITFANDAFAEMLSYNSNELLGLNLSEITNKEEYQKYELQTQIRRKEVKSESYESILLRKDKTSVNVFLSVTLLKDKNGIITESLGVVINISSMKEIEKKLLERQGELERQRDELNSFASTIAHDIRGKMQFVSFYNSMIESEYSENIDDSIDEILQFIEDILVLSRTGEILSKKTNVDIVKLVEKITTRIHKLDPEIIFSFGDIPKIYGDQIRLYQVFENLLMNIHKHAKATQVEITSQIFKNEICISINDNGKGMSEKQKQIIIDSWTTRRYTSFGMLIVNKIVEAHNGRVSLESELGKGTTVELYFPLK